MGEYNPHRPTILGNEWPGISYEPYPIDTETERGHTFRLDTSTTIVTGAFYLDSLPSRIMSHMTPMMSIYRAGTEAQTGPVKKLIIPCNGGANISGTVTLAGQATSIADALATLGDNKALSYNADPIEHSIFFDVGSVSSQLTDKRILNVSLIYSAFGVPPDNETIFFGFEAVGITPSPFTLSVNGGLEVSPEGQVTPRISRIDFGNVNLFTNQGMSEPRKYPWRYQDLQRWASGGSPQITPRIDSAGYSSNVVVYLTYVALEVTYCEENRLAYGGRSPYPIGSTQWALKQDQNIVHLRSVSAFTPGVTLAPGEYTVMFGLGATNPEFDAGGKPVVNALRQLFPIVSHTGVQVVRTLQPGRELTRTEIDVLPQLSLHTTTTAVTGVHGYGRLVSTPIYDNVTATQIILQESGGTDVPYPYIRFYARRFGNTNVALTVTDMSTTLGSVFITPQEFDALPEIIAGWKEITLKFAVPPTIDNNSSSASFRWSATSLSAGNQWEILAVDAAGGTSTPLDITSTTYAKSSGLTWNSVLDASADVVTMISQEPIELAGFSVTETTQALTNISALECSTPECIPTGIKYNQLSWTYSGAFCDSFADRTLLTSWGNDWILNGGSAANFSVSNGVGHVVINSAGARTMYRNTSSDNFHIKTEFSWDIGVPTGGSLSTWVFGRANSDFTSYYTARLMMSSTVNGQVVLEILKRVSGTLTTLNAGIVVGYNNANDHWSVEFMSAGAVLTARVENITNGGQIYTVSTTDLANSLPTGTYVGMITRQETGNTNTPTITFYDFAWSSQTLDGTGVEVQRRDEIDDEWQTIMRSSSYCPTVFNDYEARVGVQSLYRVRTFHTYNFYGEWIDDEGIGDTVTAPGITGAENGNSVLIFTSNEVQDGASNLAYVMTWDNSVTEDFSFPEADTVETRSLYRRDYPIAFHPTERGGEQFSRTIMVNNAGIASGRTQEGFRSLRDLAWADLSYVCVRNELGDRWFAWVKVPSGKIQRNRRLYLARVDIAEITNTPSQVDPTE